MNEKLRRNWLMGLTVALAAMYGWIGFAAQGISRLVGLLGAVLIVAALVAATRSRPAAAALLVVGALPLAVITWWSVVTPLLAAVALTVGMVAIRRVPSPAR